MELLRTGGQSLRPGEIRRGQAGGSNASSQAVPFGYDPVGNVTTSGHFSDTSMSTSVFTTTNTYDHIERLTAVRNNSSSVSLTQSYGYNADGWVTSESNSTDGSRTYVYDDDGRETAVNKGSGSSFVNEAYTYDLAGNRLSATSGTTHVASIGVGLNNRISSDASGSYTYDLDGNQVNRSSGSTTLTYSYNAADQQTGASQTTSGSTNFTEAYWYDPATGQRMGQLSTVAGTVTTNLYIYDPTTGNPLITLNGSGSVIERDLPGLSLGQTLAVDNGIVGSGAGTTSWLITDNVGSVTDVLNNSGAVIDHTTYDSFGTVTAQSNARGGTRFDFSGMIADSLTGENLDDLRDEANGRFTTPDPTGFGGRDYNLYRYCGGDPGTYEDPTGLLLVAFGGTGSKDAAPNSVRNFASDYARSGIGDAWYYNGPPANKLVNGCGLAGIDEELTTTDAVSRIKDFHQQHPDEPIDLIGHSRGGAEAAEVARRLREAGIHVRWLGLYDPVLMSPGFGTDGIPLNVDYVSVIVPYTGVGTRWSWNRMSCTTPNVNTKVIIKYVWGTHGAIGGNPWKNPEHVNTTGEADYLAAMVADQTMRKNFTSETGVPLGVPSQADYRRYIWYNEDWENK